MFAVLQKIDVVLAHQKRVPFSFLFSINVLEFARVLVIQSINEVLDCYLHLESGGYIRAR